MFWKNGPFVRYGIVLGCEVAGVGRPVGDSDADKGAAVHVIQKLSSVMVGYVLVIAPDELSNKEYKPRNLNVKTDMLAAFDLIRAGQF